MTSMTAVTIAWIALTLFIGFTIYLVPKVDRYLSIVVALASLAYGLGIIFYNVSDNLQLLDRFGVTLAIDSLSGYFILTNALVTAAVVLYCWQTDKTAFFYTQLVILHGSVNSVFLCADFISLYVALEVISIAVFLIIAYPRSDRSIWVALRYLFISNTAMLFYTIGAVLVYQSSHSFAFASLSQAPTEAIALIFLGLLTKGGIFISGMWLPLTHSESETPVSALLSGSVIKTGVFPMVRLALTIEEIQPIVGIFAVGTALLGVGYAIFEQDTKRMLAWSTISQLGFVMLSPATAGFYALTHGVAKASLFSIAGNLPSRNFRELQQTRIPTPVWIALSIAALSVAGCPLLAGFGAKILALKQLDYWQAIGANLAAIGTAIVCAKLIFLPHGNPENPEKAKPVKLGLWLAVVPLLSVLLLANGFYLPAYTAANLLKASVSIGIGWLIYFVIYCSLARRFTFKLPRMFEQFDHLIGIMSLMLVLLFWMVLE